MKDREYKTFKDEVPQWFEEFEYLNKILESFNFWSIHLFTAYLDILLEELDEKNCNTVHYEIQYLLDTKKVSCNKILEFWELKYKSCYEMCLDLIEYIWVLDQNLGNHIIDFIEWRKQDFKIKIYWFNWEIKIFELDNNMNFAELYYLLKIILDIYVWKEEIEEQKNITLN